ncbi:hypothetical protein FIBSPDRAFT_300830 [Athelia psychrophila]|uniref:F-box domain-containing protein n=1 Tax=Athelia psychrophila TaxID=1759441 RepID=A0A166QWU0_9AGAM|nr:hypothetical protein FIBSPDRAFT_300830 [Fibularhizoctonia sp. CBS 109695]
MRSTRNFRERLFASGGPRMTAAQLVRIDASALRLCLPTFESVTSLRLVGISIVNVNEYTSFRDALMAMKSMTLLELQMDRLDLAASSRLPILMPTIQSLFVRNAYVFSGWVEIPPIHAGALVVLWLEGSLNTEAIEKQLPLLQHLILNYPDYLKLDRMSRAFPQIQRLTSPSLDSDYSVHQILAAIGTGYRVGDDTFAGRSGMLWPRLHTIAGADRTGVSGCGMLRNTISELQAAGHPICKLMLTNVLHAHIDADMAELRKVVEVEEYSLGWPTPFKW